MNRRIAAILVSLLAACVQPAGAKPLPAASASAPASQAAAPPDTRLVEHGSYVNSDGNRVHVPAHTVDGSVPSGASAQCRDGSYSFSAHARGTCSHHGGVARWR